MLGRRPDFATFTIGTSYRLGPATVAAISPLYDFPFVSGRPERAIIDRDGAALDELDSIDVGPVTDYNDPQMLGLVVQRADALVGLTRHDADQPTPRQVRAADVAVVLSRNTQVCFVRAMLDARGHDRITVGTADRLQGGQWAAVVALDPFAGSDDITSHNLSLGRLCVMTSRHTTHLTWVHDGQWQQRLTTASLDPSTVKRGTAVRRALTAWQTEQAKA